MANNEHPIIPLDLGDPESLTDALQSQVAFYKGEYENLRVETKALVLENAQISRQLDSLLQTKCNHESVHTQEESNKMLIEEMKQQVKLSQKEKDSFLGLWRASQKTVKSLEAELLAYQSHQKNTSFPGDIDEVKREYSAVIKMLESKITSAYEDIKIKEKSLIGVSEEISLNKKIILDKEKCISDYVRKQNELNMKIECLEKELSCHKNELATSKRNCQDLLNNMELCRSNVDVYAKKESECRYKVAEALRIVDAAISERDAATEREQNASDEATRMSNQVTDILKESSIRVQKEIDVAKQGYNDKLNDMLIHIQRLELEMGEKNLSLERSSRECKLLEDELDRSRKGVNSVGDENDCKLLLLEQKLEATFQQLVLSERRNIQIVSEKESLQMDFDQITSGFQRDKRRREWEEKLHSNEINSLRAQIGNLRVALDEAHKSIQRMQSELITKEQLQETLTNEKLAAAKEFERHFETQQKLNLKWKESIKDITGKLQNRLEELGIENKRLRKENHKRCFKYDKQITSSDSPSLENS